MAADDDKPGRRRTGDDRACLVCSAGPDARLVSVERLPERLSSWIATRHAERWDPEGAICHVDLMRARIEVAMERLRKERGELGEVESEIARRAASHTAISERVGELFAPPASRGQRIADGVARVGGSWSFVITFLTALLGWTLINSFLLRRGAFDPYPYILLNLLLSCVAALQAPVIMMSQNRMSSRDRAQADQDYKINLKAEMEIASLHEKLDHLLHDQWEQLIELQEIQLDLLTQLAERRGA